MAQRSRVLLLIPHLGGGGAEQVTALLAQGLSREKYEVHLGLITQKDGGIEHPPPAVTVHAFGAERVRAAALPLLRLVRHLKPDLILSGMAHLNFLVLLLRPLFPQRTRVLVRQNATVSTVLASGYLPGYTRLLYRLLYRHADRVICQSPAMVKDMELELVIPPERLAVLPNPVDVDAIRKAVDDNRGPAIGEEPRCLGPHLLAVGRLSKEKGFDLLLRAMVTVRERFPQADLTIMGEGPERTSLEAERTSLELDDAVHFAGYVKPPYAYLRDTSLFALPSRHEGLPNALLEAAAAGLPILACPASEGLVELLHGQPGTWVAPESTSGALAATLIAALESLGPGERFEHRFIEEFRFERAIQAYEELIDSVLEERSQ
jgi:glycosyltransferase involved in cell wall biosynthesis